MAVVVFIFCANTKLEHREDCKNMLDEAHNALVIIHEYVARLEVDMKVRAGELQAVKNSNKRIVHERGDSEVDERDELMNEVRRHLQFQKEMDYQAAQNEAENTLCTSLLERMNQLIKNLEEDVKNAAQEDTIISEFSKLIDTETSSKRTRRPSHSNRKKMEANRLVKQAGYAADLQKLVQHFMHHVIEQEKRIMCQKQRILNGEHKVELLESSENWYHVVKELSVSCKGAKEKVEKCKIWAQVEDVYSVSKPQEKDEDMVMTSPAAAAC
ncbi:hypothetical protein PF005_g1808 [Phytophthora fragariae]|uniref:Uncharacterized protein n=1 Tax=Phytophthora fragariae TaxID=53985 RepID=A0A6A3US93_9STRA|nr:hypothetical protein PF006_g1269 [Phytophthora fragariae]KAE9234649.1 hypothetical protein PF005_g1808 [Phytophthora fragariae]